MWVSFKQQDYKGKKWEESQGKTDYQNYRFTQTELMLTLAEGTVYILILNYFFYRSLKWIFLLSPFLALFLKNKKKEFCKKREQKLVMQFKDMLNSVSGSLQAGYSLENAFMEAYKDICHYYGADSIMAKELYRVKRGLHNGKPLEEMVRDIGIRSGVEDISSFGNVMSIAKRSGGNLREIIQKSITVIEEKLETEQEIQTLISARELETRIMAIIPFFIILYIELTSKGYFNAMYQTVGGRILMTICLIMYLSAICISKKIVAIHV